MTTPVVTALRAHSRRGRVAGRVAVDLDGRPWRTVPLEAVVAAGLAVGRELDRASARALGRELRRVEARQVALRALRARDHTSVSLAQRLADRGTRPALNQETVEVARRAGLVDDRRFASERAALLARRGAGDLLIAHDLEHHGVPAAVVSIAIEGLEAEAARAALVMEARGRSARTARFLVAKGFSEATLEPLVAELAADALG